MTGILLLLTILNLPGDLRTRGAVATAKATEAMAKKKVHENGISKTTLELP